MPLGVRAQTAKKPKAGSQTSVSTSKAPKNTEEVAQIHTHGAYTEKHYDKNLGCYVEEQGGFSSEDIRTAAKLETDTYVVTPWGNMYKATFEKNYSDKDTIFCNIGIVDSRLKSNNTIDVHEEQYKQSLGG